MCIGRPRNLVECDAEITNTKCREVVAAVDPGPEHIVGCAGSIGGSSGYLGHGQRTLLGGDNEGQDGSCLGAGRRDSNCTRNPRRDHRAGGCPC